MASLRVIRRRIKSVKSTQQIMRAMQLVSASKFKRAQTQMIKGRGVMDFLDGLIERVLKATESVNHPLCEKREGQTALIIITSDAGLCGAYNANLIQMAESILRRESAQPDELIFIGKRAYRHFVKKGFQAAESYLDWAGRPNVAVIETLGKRLMNRFLKGELASISILSSKMLSASASKPVLNQWLPASVDTGQEDENPSFEGTDEYIFEPSSDRVFEELLPRWALTRFILTILETFTAEHSARMIAMKNATDNAKELLESLTRQRNRIRQAAITTEISEIVGTAEALNA